MDTLSLISDTIAVSSAAEVANPVSRGASILGTWIYPSGFADLFKHARSPLAIDALLRALARADHAYGAYAFLAPRKLFWRRLWCLRDIAGDEEIVHYRHCKEKKKDYGDVSVIHGIT